MAPSTRNSQTNGGGLNPDQIVVQLAKIASRLESIELQLRSDVAVLKARMFGTHLWCSKQMEPGSGKSSNSTSGTKPPAPSALTTKMAVNPNLGYPFQNTTPCSYVSKPTSNQTPPPTPATPLTLTNYGAIATHTNTKSTHCNHSSTQANVLHDQKIPHEPNLSTFIIILSPPPLPAATSMILTPNTIPKPASKPAPKPAWNTTHRHHKLSSKTTRARTKNRNHTIPQNTRLLAIAQQRTDCHRQREGPPPWPTVKTAPNVVARLEWRPPWGNQFDDWDMSIFA